MRARDAVANDRQLVVRRVERAQRRRRAGGDLDVDAADSGARPVDGDSHTLHGAARGQRRARRDLDGHAGDRGHHDLHRVGHVERRAELAQRRRIADRDRQLAPDGVRLRRRERSAGRDQAGDDDAWRGAAGLPRQRVVIGQRRRPPGVQRGQRIRPALRDVGAGRREGRVDRQRAERRQRRARAGVRRGRHRERGGAGLGRQQGDSGEPARAIEAKAGVAAAAAGRIGDLQVHTG